MKRVLVLAAVTEAATGVALLIVPALVGRLLLGEELTGAAIPVARVAGIALIALGLACWPGAESVGANTPALRGLVMYNLPTTLYLASLGIDGGSVGSLLWPVVVIHAVLTLLLGRAWLVEPAKQ
jgi:hypothetical protein